MADTIEIIPKSMIGKAKDQQRNKAQDFVSKYANSISVSLSNWDVNITYGRIKGENIIEETVEILLSKEMAKVFTAIMTAHLNAYEEKFGEIKIIDINQLKPKVEGIVSPKEGQVLASAARRKKK
jgi:hypothetical protein